MRAELVVTRNNSLILIRMRQKQKIKKPRSKDRGFLVL